MSPRLPRRELAGPSGGLPDCSSPPPPSALHGLGFGPGDSPLSGGAPQRSFLQPSLLRGSGGYESGSVGVAAQQRHAFSPPADAGLGGWACSQEEGGAFGLCDDPPAPQRQRDTTLGLLQPLGSPEGGGAGGHTPSWLPCDPGTTSIEQLFQAPSRRSSGGLGSLLPPSCETRGSPLGGLFQAAKRRQVQRQAQTQQAQLLGGQQDGCEGWWWAEEHDGPGGTPLAAQRSLKEGWQASPEAALPPPLQKAAPLRFGAAWDGGGSLPGFLVAPSPPPF